MAQRFWLAVTKSDGCWLWSGATVSLGYGRLSMDGGRKLILAHRASWMIHRGPIPNGMCVLHRCDVPGCVNPDHLFLGTPGDNVRDCVAKGRKNQARGSANHAKLTEASVREIRARAAAGARKIDLAREYGVSSATVRSAIKRRKWKHVQ